MNELLQSAMQHPDADQLTAFAEHALPAHEREQTLAHLAVCSACREVVFLAQEAVPVEVVGPVAAPRRPWFAGWNLVWPAVGALAAIVAVTVHLGTVTKAPERVTTADAVTVTAPPVQLQTESAMAAAPLPIAKAAPPPKAAIALEQPKVVVPAPAVVGGMAGGSGTGVAGGIAQRAGVQANAPLGGPMQNQNGYLQQNQVVVNAAPQVPAAAPATPMAMAGLASRAAAPMAAPAPPPAPVQANSTVTVSAANIDALSDDASSHSNETLPLNGRNVANLASSTPALPSHLAAISTVASGPRSVAVDSKGGVFLSTDGGRKWKSVKAAWTGQAVAVRTVASGAVYVDGFTGGTLPAAQKMTTMRTKQPSSNAARADLEGSVTDMAGAVVPGATVKVSLVAGGNVMTARSNGNGAFTLVGLAPGDYRVEIAAPGFEQYVDRRTLVAGERAEMPVRLQIGAASETITVQSADTQVETKKKVAATPVFALKTDAGVVWVSVDGKKWTRQ